MHHRAQRRAIRHVHLQGIPGLFQIQGKLDQIGAPPGIGEQDLHGSQYPALGSTTFLSGAPLAKASRLSPTSARCEGMPRTAPARCGERIAWSNVAKSASPSAECTPA